jgi:signal transduction histidine kinase
VAREVVEHLDPRHTQDYQLHLNIPEYLTVWADPHYLRQILRNLLSNAFKYCPRQTAVVISAALSEWIAQGAASPAQVCISVKDTGPGIPPTELPLLFGKFVRLKRDLTGTTRGSGLGLYISKQLVEAMHGRIWVESTGRAGEGSCFYFTLPTPAHASLERRTKHLVSP